MAHLMTTLGPKSAAEMRVMLPHEHIFVDLRVGDQPEQRQVTAAAVIGLMTPEIAKIQALGVTALVECTPVGVGRRVDLVQAVSAAANFAIVAPTGVYREPWIPEWVHLASEVELREWMLQELQDEIEHTKVPAGWIKLSAGDQGLTECEAKILRAAAKAGKATNAVIGSHTILGRVVLQQLDIIEAAGYWPDRFIWIHAQNEPDFNLHLAAARRGAWIEYDAIGGEKYADEFFVQRIQDMLAADLGDHLLLSHDRGWYDLAQPKGGTPRPFTYLQETFLDKLRLAGVDEPTIRQLTQTNPFRAFAR